MSTNSLAERQHDLIVMLLAENAYLKRMLSSLLPGGEGITAPEKELLEKLTGRKESVYSNPQNEDGQNPSSHSNDHSANGISDTIDSNQEISNGISDVTHSNDNFLNGITKINDSNQNFVNGIMAANNFIDKTYYGITGVSYSNANPAPRPLHNNDVAGDMGKGMQGVGDMQLTAMSGKRKPDLVMVRTHLRQVMKTASHRSVTATAQMLIELDADPTTPLASLRKLTGLSVDGMAKRIMAMKKADLIARKTAPLRFEPTPKAKAMLMPSAT